jgi:hypothetical protein
VRAHRIHLHVPAWLGPAAEDQVHLMMIKERADPVPVSCFQHHPDLRVELPEAAEQPGDYLLGRRRHCRDAKFAPVGIRGADGRSLRLIQQAENLAHVAGILRAGLGQPQATAVRAQQLHR